MQSPIFTSLLTLIALFPSYSGAAETARHRGTLAANGGQPWDFYELEVPKSLNLVVEVRSESFDTYLALSTPTGELITNDDFQGSTARSRVEISDATSGRWFLAVTSFDRRGQGEYHLYIPNSAELNVLDERVILNDAPRLWDLISNPPVTFFSESQEGARSESGEVFGLGAETTPETASLSTIDLLLDEMDFANIAFNLPRSMKVGETVSVTLILSRTDDIEELILRVGTEGAEAEGAEIRFTDRMEARLSGSGFSIEAITPERQGIARKQPTLWRWEVTAREPGVQRLHLTLTAILALSGSDVPRAIRTFERVIEVRVDIKRSVVKFASKNLEWLLLGVLIPLIGWLWRLRRARKE